MTDTPELDQFKADLQNLRTHPLLKKLIARNQVKLGALMDEDVATLTRHEPAKYFLLAAAGLNRTTLKKAAQEPEAAIVEKKLRQAYAIKHKLPETASFDKVITHAEALRSGDLGRKARGGIEALFRQRLAAEGIPVLMAPPIRAVPGILVSRRKPDGVWPDPSTAPPIVYLEIKNLRRVADDIQKRLYEIAEASLEMKLLYGDLDLRGLSLPSTKQVLEGADEIRRQLRARIVKVRPAVVALFLCPAREAAKYRAGAEAFIDRLFFEEEIEECLAYLRAVIAAAHAGDSNPSAKGRAPRRAGGGLRPRGTRRSRR